MPAVLGNLLKQYAGTHYKYDARSNLIEKQQGEQATKFSWDGFNRLSKISSQAGETKYFYDVFGRRIGKENAKGKTEFIWDGDVIALEKTAEHTRHYLFEPNSFIPLAQIVSANDSEQEHTAYYHVDHLGTPQTLSDENGEIAWSAEYKAWGEAQVVISEAAKTAGINNPIRFQGQYFDEESGLHYNRHRYYDPEIGRFISSDPIGLMGGLNTHAYAPNPVEWIDPLGLAKFGSGKGTHTATVTVQNQQGTTTSSSIYQSGNMTEEEKALGFPQSTLATHTEARAMKDLDLKSGGNVLIEGEYPPCTSCKGKMNKKAKQSGSSIKYTWPSEQGQTNIWTTKK